MEFFLLFLTSSLDCLVFTTYLIYFLDEKQNKAACAIYVVLFLFAGFFKHYIILAYDNAVAVINIVSLSAPLLTFALIVLLIKGSNTKKFFFIFTYSFIASTCEVLYVIVYSLIYSQEAIYNQIYSTQDSIQLQISRFILIGENALVTYPIMKFFKRVRVISNTRSLFLFLPLPICGSVLLEVHSGLFFEQKISIMILFLLLSMCCLILVCFFFLAKTLYERKMDEQKLEFYEEEMRRQLAYSSELSEHHSEMKKLRHDFRNHLQVAYGAMQASDISTAKDFLDDINKSIDESDIWFCENALVNVLLCDKSKVARAKGINSDYNIFLRNDIGIKPIYLASIFSNLLDNAIRACEGIEPGLRYMELNVFEKENKIFLSISNSSKAAPRKINSTRFFSTKESSEEHGLGLYIIEKIVADHNGIIEYKFENNIFTINLFMEEKD